MIFFCRCQSCMGQGWTGQTAVVSRYVSGRFVDNVQMQAKLMSEWVGVPSSPFFPRFGPLDCAQNWAGHAGTLKKSCRKMFEQSKRCKVAAGRSRQADD